MKWWQRIAVWLASHDRDEYYHVAGYGHGGVRLGCRCFYNPYARPVERWWECTPTCRKSLRRLRYLLPKVRVLP